jgi:hypothetical protein
MGQAVSNLPVSACLPPLQNSVAIYPEASRPPKVDGQSPNADQQPYAPHFPLQRRHSRLEVVSSRKGSYKWLTEMVDILPAP